MTTEPDTTVDEAAGLKTKNSQLIGTNKKLQQQIDDLMTEKEQAEAHAAEKAGDIEKIKSQLESKHKKEIEALNAQISTLSGDLRSIRVDAEISSAIAKGNVIQDHVEAVEALLHRRVQYDDGVASIDGQSIADFTKSYFSKTGAVYVNAPNNSGAGTTGNDGSTTVNSFTTENFSSRTGEWMALAKSDPAQAKAIAISVGRKDLAEDL